MQKFLFLFVIFPILFCFSTAGVVDLFCGATMIDFYKDGQQVLLSQKEQNKIDNLFSEAIEDSFSMPAFAVSLDNLTKEEMKSGLWLEFVFDKTMSINEMPFDSLLVNVNKDQYGINLIRGNDGLYEGRCFYLDLRGKNLDELYDYLSNINSNEENFEIENQQIEKTEIVEEENDKKGKELTKSQKTLLEKLG